MAIVTLNFVPPTDPDFTSLHIYEGPTVNGSFNEIEVIANIGIYPNYITTYTTSLAISVTDWFAIAWRNSSGGQTYLSQALQGDTTTAVAEIVRRVLLREPTFNEAAVTQEAEAVVEAQFNTTNPYDPLIHPTAIQYSDMVITTIARYRGITRSFYGSIPAMAGIDDINAHLPTEFVTVTSDDDLAAVQLSVSRTIRGYLSRIYSTAVLASWITPDVTPDIVREVAGMLVAAQFYINKTAQTNTIVDDKHFAQRLYDNAIALLVKLSTGEIPIPGVDPDTPVEGFSTLDFWPINATDRAFTMGQRLD